MPDINQKIENLPPQRPRPETNGEQNEQRAANSAAERKFMRADEKANNQKPAAAVAAATDDGAPSDSPFNIKNIERVLSSELEDVYFAMPPDAQRAFKQKGEETARQIQTLLQKTKVNVKKIARFIVDWLKLIPGVNKFFLEQESKIITDEVLKLKKGGER